MSTRRLSTVAAGMMMAAMPLGEGAGVLERLVMPGPLVERHAEYEADCGRCHAFFSKRRQSRLCLNCHEDVAADVESGEGYHGRVEGIAKGECRRCHTDHKGRQVDIVGLDEETFDHRESDFSLSGAHVLVRCLGCHPLDARYRDAPLDCQNCHERDDPHLGRLGSACGDCHVENTWAAAEFDHDRTDFPLTGGHGEVSCKACHPNQHYQGAPVDCYDCHRLNDAHGGSHGRQCERCHSTAEWTKEAFDHDRETEFPLLGRHRTTRCQHCHKTDIFEDELGIACVGCHRADDEHKGRNGEECHTCHTAEAWVPSTFDHDKDTSFVLRGRHSSIRCEACHPGPVYGGSLPSDCYGCHLGDDVHSGLQGRNCDQCHGEQSWSADVLFDHDLTSFPLGGLHAVTPCEECHLGQDYKAAPRACAECHRGVDEHESRLGEQCGLCHTPNGWNIWSFDHSARTNYPLKGAHEGLDCRSCHQEPTDGKITVPSDCFFCHRSDDVHRGNLGRRCERCHSTTAFEEVLLR